MRFRLLWINFTCVRMHITYVSAYAFTSIATIFIVIEDACSQLRFADIWTHPPHLDCKWHQGRIYCWTSGIIQTIRFYVHLACKNKYICKCDRPHAHTYCNAYVHNFQNLNIYISELYWEAVVYAFSVICSYFACLRYTSKYSRSFDYLFIYLCV